MVLIIVILALAMEHFISSLDEYRRIDLLEQLSNWLLQKSEQFNGWLGVLVIAGIIGAGTQYIYLLLSGWATILGLLFASLVLVLCFGPKNFREQIKLFCEAVEAKNLESAFWHLERIKYHPLHIDEKSNIVATALQTLFVAVNNRLLGVIFWFIILGPIGAILYRMSSVFHFQNFDEERSAFNLAFDKVYYIMNWPCARLVALSYAVVGSFTDVIRHLKGSVSATEYWPDANENLLVNTGLASMHLDQEDKDLTCEDVTNGLALLRRSVAFWVGVIALMTLAGWLG